MFFLKVCLIVNRQKRQANKLAEEIFQWFAHRDLPVYYSNEDPPENVEGGIPIPRREMAGRIDIIFVLGGDGTFLNVARFFAGQEIPLLGFNLGRMGFLTEMDSGNLNNILENLLQDKYYIEERMMLEGTVYRDGKKITRVVGLNDIVVSKGAFARVIELTLYISGEIITTYPGDGMVVATPTGSTAYSLSAGGPIISPSVKSLVVTPICPHTLYARSLVVQHDDIIEIEVERADRRIMLTVDGQEGIRLGVGDIVRLTGAREKTYLVRFEGSTFYQILRTRLNYKNV